MVRAKVNKRTIRAQKWDMRKFCWYSANRAPTPMIETRSWPMTTPLTPRIMPSRIPARISGNAAKSTILARSKRLAPKEWDISISEGEMFWTPALVSSTMIQTANMKTVTTTVGVPNPNRIMKIGTSAERGADRKTLTHMLSMSSTGLNRPMRTPIVMPTANASPMPIA